MAPRPSAGLGIEDELSFGSDEDLIADVGELMTHPGGSSSGVMTSNPNSVPPLPPISARIGKEKEKKSGMFKLGGHSSSKKEDKGKRNRTATDETIKLAAPIITSSNHVSSAGKKDKSSKHLAKSALVIDPTLESVLDLTNMNPRPPQQHNPIHKLDTRDSFGSSTGSGSGSASASLLGHGIGSSPNLLTNSKDSPAKKKGLMGAFRGFGKTAKKEDVAVHKGVAQMRSRESFGTRSDSSRQQSLDFTSSTFSSPRTDASSFQHHHLAPIPMSPFEAHAPDSNSDHTRRSSNASASLSKHTSTPSFPRRASVLTSTSAGTADTGESAHLIPQSVLHKMSVADQDNQSPVDHRAARPHLISRSTTSSLGIPPSPLSHSLGDITSVLLPTFPATLLSLSSIQILSATVIRRVFISGSASNPSGMGMPDKERNSSIRSLTNALSSGTSGNSSSPQKKPMWITQQLVLTSFKVGGITPQSTPNPNEYSNEGGSTSRTIAHLHLFNVPGPSQNKSPTKSAPVGFGIGSGGSGSSQSFGRRPSLTNGAEEMEVDRRVIRGDNTASIWEGEEAKRKFVMRVGFGRDQVEGDGEWVLEMRNADQLQDWIRQLKSVAIVIRAETEGHGQAIRDAYTSGSVRGDDLALELDMQRQSANARSPTSASTSSGPTTTSGLGIPISAARESFISELSATGLLPVPPPREEPGISGRPELSQRPSAARAESPDMLGSPAQESEDRLSSQVANLHFDIHRSKSFSHRGSQSSSPDSSRPEVPVLGAVSPTKGQISRVGGSLHRHTRQGSWSSSASGGSSAAVRKYGRMPLPPPPSAPPPSAPLPALPTGPEFTPSFRASSDGKFEPRLSQPDESEVNLAQVRQTSRSASLPAASSPDEEAKLAALKARKDRLMNSFRPIPLVPELETSPRSSPYLPENERGSLSGREGMPTVASPQIFVESVQSPTFRPPATPRTKSATSVTTLGTVLSTEGEYGNGESSDFYTPTEMTISTFPLPPTTSTSTQDSETLESFLSTPTTINNDFDSSSLSVHGGGGSGNGIGGEGRPETTRYASSISSVPSISSAGTGTSGGRRRREKKVAVDIMSEFSENPDANYTPEGEDEIIEDRPRAIRFA